MNHHDEVEEVEGLDEAHSEVEEPNELRGLLGRAQGTAGEAEARGRQADGQANPVNASGIFLYTVSFDDRNM